jgi:hypothetical protein
LLALEVNLVCADELHKTGLKKIKVMRDPFACYSVQSLHERNYNKNKT